MDSYYIIGNIFAASSLVVFIIALGIYIKNTAQTFFNFSEIMLIIGILFAGWFFIVGLWPYLLFSGVMWVVFHLLTKKYK